MAVICFFDNFSDIFKVGVCSSLFSGDRGSGVLHFGRFLGTVYSLGSSSRNDAGAYLFGPFRKDRLRLVLVEHIPFLRAEVTIGQDLVDFDVWRVIETEELLSKLVNLS